MSSHASLCVSFVMHSGIKISYANKGGPSGVCIVSLFIVKVIIRETILSLSDRIKPLKYPQASDIKRNNIYDHSDVVGASPVGSAATSSSFST